MRLVFSLFVLVLFANCTFNDRGGVQPGPPGTGGFTPPIPSGTGGRMTGPCMNLQCQQTTCMSGNCMVPACAAGATTTVTGKVYDPAGKIPLYNANVYVPNAALAPIVEGATCDRCTALTGSPVTETITDATGSFRLENVPVGASVPLVIQIGKWRRETTIPVTACVDNALTDVNLTRLPRNKSEGHIPKIAVTTGGIDALECLLRKIGIEDAEFTREDGDGRVNLFAGGLLNGTMQANDSAGANQYAPTLNGGAMFTDASTWWISQDNLMRYDLVLHACEGLENPTNKPQVARDAMKAYADAGGRVFASHWHNYWIERGPAPWPTVATFRHRNDPTGQFFGTIDTGFARGTALSQWMVAVGGSPMPGQIEIVGAQHTVDAVNAALSQRWIYRPTNPASVQYFDFTTPVESPQGARCGKVVFSDIHVSSGSGSAMEDASDPTLPFPTGCRTQDLTPQEKVLLFMLFDLSACLKPIIE